MVPESFEVTMRRGATRTTISCSGQLDPSSAPRLQEAIDVALGERPRSLVFDGARITSLSRHGIEVLFQMVKKARSQGTKTALRIGDPVRQMLDAVGLGWLGSGDDRLLVQERLDLALRSYAQLFRSREPESRALSFPLKSEYFIG